MRTWIEIALALLSTIVAGVSVFLITRKLQAADERSCVNDCSAHGVCDRKTGACSCVQGYAGVDCSVNSASDFAQNLQTLSNLCPAMTMSDAGRALNSTTLSDGEDPWQGVLSALGSQCHASPAKLSSVRQSL